jgi:hypothetical protein
MTIADSLGLKAKNDVEKRLLDYLNEHCSDMLAFKIQAGTKTLQGCVEYIKGEVKKRIEKEKQKGSVCMMVEDDDVFGMMIHFFEEDSIEEPNKKKPKKAAEVKKPESPKPEPVDNTMVMDLFADDEERPF